ncbi:deoxyribonuclease-1 [Elysia marginata]|uniref:Deoxyribonuclease-1 n=1 Tax=Elysia marginata TaxID=1093978 RepID=A0AAV4EEU0_9GAST|nr:deoxyribonuclease-1 [Elysia marginata]
MALEETQRSKTDGEGYYKSSALKSHPQSTRRVCLGACFLLAICLSFVKEADPISFSKSFDAPVRVASFNIRNFGKTKMSKPVVARSILKIMNRCDLVFIMETRDRKMMSLVKLRKELGETEWDYVTSEPIGRLSPLPSTAISSAERIFPDSQAHIIMGDLNADYSYLTCAEREATPLFSTPELSISLVPDKADKTVWPSTLDTVKGPPSTDSACDRVIVTVHDLPKVKVTNVKVYDF